MGEMLLCPHMDNHSSLGSCRRAGYTDCCEGGACEGVPGGCFCDPFCSDFDDCCEDLEEICPGIIIIPELLVTIRVST